MKLLIPTSNYYAHLIEPCHILLNKYWPDNDVVFLGFDSKKVPELPSNCTFVSLGNQEDFGKEWTTPLIPFIEQLHQYLIIPLIWIVLACMYTLLRF